ncbi:MAG: glycosyltransferase family 2 protein [Bacillota bacterium]|nr:glycosyltransferase family 2 protein [Bacillota bacterium]
MEAYKVSLIVPVYNTEAYLKRCVASLREQSYENLEIILVDDGSTDNSGKLCDEYERQDARIKVIHKKNGGLISAWKAGVEGSTGEYLCFVDSDDWVDTAMVSEMAKQLSGSDREIISSDYVIEWENGNKQYVWQELPAGVYEGAELKRVVPRLLGQEKRYVCISRCMKLISRSLIENNCKYSDPAIRMGEDTTIMLPSLIDCKRLVIMDHKAYYHYFYVNESMVHKYDRNLFKNIELLRKISLKERIFRICRQGRIRNFCFCSFWH